MTDSSESESESSSSSSSDFSFTDTEDEEDFGEELDSDRYEPDENVSSDEDTNGCCRWSKTRNCKPNQIEPLPGIPEFGKPLQVFDDSYEPHDIVDDPFEDTCIDALNEHAKIIQYFSQYLVFCQKTRKAVH